MGTCILCGTRRPVADLIVLIHEGSLFWACGAASYYECMRAAGNN